MELRGGGKSSNREAPVIPGARRVDRAATSSSFRPWWRKQLAPATESKSTDAENRNHRLRRALHRIDLGRLNRHLSGETFQTYFFGPRCPEPPTAANQQSAVERMKASAALAMLMRRPRRHRRRQAHSQFSLALWSGSTSPNTTYRPPRHGREATRRSASRRWISPG
jgi:hypothetical protein